MDRGARMDNGNANILHFLFLLLLLFPLSSSFPLCSDLRAPRRVRGHLGFCQYSGNACCSVHEDLQLEREFLAMNISDSACASSVKSIICARCDPFAARLFNADLELRPLPFLCNSTTGNSSSSFCSTVWDSCQHVVIPNSPFAPALQTRAQVTQNSTATALIDLWQSESDFCTAFGGSPEANSTCLNGEPVSLNRTDALPPPNGLCFEKLGNGSYLNMVPHPDGSNRAFFSTMAGKVFLATIPDQDSGDVLGLDQSNLFVDLTDQIHLDTTFGMMGMAFHPNFATNGRFFASFNCDRNKSPTCRRLCSCNSDVGCDPSELVSSGGQPCRYHSVVAEYTANGSASSPSMAETASPLEVRRIFTLGLPFTSNHGGQILFGPADGYLYIMMGDGGGRGDPYNFAQNKRSLLGKIMRVDVDNIPSEEEIVRLGRWGNYSVPADNPYSEDREMEQEIWAYGLSNPWRCSFDSERPSYLLCGDDGQDRYEEVDLISKGGNYGWRVYEGPLVFQARDAPGGNTSRQSIDPIFPAFGYTHSNINKLGSAAIIGGYFYRSQTDPCAHGSYVYGDLYANHIWAAPETPRDSGNFTASDIPFSCAPDSPMKCDLVLNSSLPAFQFVFSFGEDNRRDVYVLSQSGVYRVVRPSRCNYTCAKEAFASPSTSHPPAAQSAGCAVIQPSLLLLISLSGALLFLCSLF